ncbi:SRPBCC family protein [Cellulomonas endophytica]|uniref:SRPBCC family protein n=1 Tax=Cellulomonas endophytica TaxID=2494735 RepID=UPI0010126FDA|nr:SRPBCC family protein [Cellulomonas endophytica]
MTPDPSTAPTTAGTGVPARTLLGALTPDGDGRRSVRFERRYPTDPADLWSALTEPDRLARWLGVLTGDLRPGGRYHLGLGASEEDHARGAIRTCAPPHHLEVDWSYPGEDESWVEVTLAAVPGGTALTLVHHRLVEDQAVGYGAGWHAYLDVLAAHGLGPAADGPGDGPDGWEARFGALLPAYRTAATGG